MCLKLCTVSVPVTVLEGFKYQVKSSANELQGCITQDLIKVKINFFK